MTPEKQWPDDLPCVLLAGRSHQVVNPKISTQFASGRSRERRAFTAVPVRHDVRWVMKRSQAALFEAWYQDELVDGTEWFGMEMHLPQGDGPWPFRFVGVYDGPVKVGPDLWEISATLEQWLRAGEAAPIDSSVYRVTESGAYRILE